jgi:hypothetical protein
MFSTAARQRHVAKRLADVARLDSAPASLYQSQRSDRARTPGNARKTKGCARQPPDMLMARWLNAERISNKLDLLVHDGPDRIRGVLAPKAAVGRSNIVTIRG